MSEVVVSGSFDDLRSQDIRFLDEASRLGNLHVVLWDDACVEKITGKPPKFPLAERKYVVDAVRYVSSIIIGDANHRLSDLAQGKTLVLRESQARQTTPESVVIPDSVLQQYPPIPPCPTDVKSTRKKVVVTGCFDWLHSGHVRFFEEISELGDLYVVAGNDANIEHLKGTGHPLFPAIERIYMIGAFKYVTAAIVTTGMGWLDGEPEFRKIQPDIYAVNEDGDKPEKKQFCEENGIEYKVLKRTPKEGLQRRQSTALRGF